MSLPDGYTQVEYIESSGEQYIDTGFSPNQNSSIESVFQTTQTSQGGICTTDTAWKSNGFGIWVNAAAYGDNTVTNISLYGNDKIIAKLDKNRLYKNAELIWTASESTFQTTKTLTICALNRSGSMSEYVSGRIYGVKIWDNGTMIRDFIPCKNASGTVGLWDDVNSVFYGNSGSGDFVAGPEMLPPDATTNLHQVLQVKLAWTAVECEGYHVYRDGTMLGSTTDTWFVDDTAVANMVYTYSVAAYNGSLESDPVTLQVDTREGYAVIRPVVSSAFFQ